MINKTDDSFRTKLLSKDRKGCIEYLSTNLSVEKLVSSLHDLLFLSGLIIHSQSTIHPVCIVNSIKNFISDDKSNPSEILLSFLIDYLFQFEVRDNDKIIFDNALRKGVAKTAFIGDLEDACQNGEWDKAESQLADIFIASDQSRGAFDALAGLALQDCPQNALYVYHILRAYQFQERKEDNWTFTCSLFNYIKNKKLPRPHKREKINLEALKSGVIKEGDVVFFSAMNRILEGKYTRSEGYNREITFWMSKIDFPKLKFLKNKNKLRNSKSISFSDLAEKIISMEKIESQKLLDIVTLEALRFILKDNDKLNFDIIMKRFPYFLS